MSIARVDEGKEETNEDREVEWKEGKEKYIEVNEG